MRLPTTMLAMVIAIAGAAVADEPTPAPTPPPADCSIVDAAEAGKILGYDVAAPDEVSRSGGICYYSSLDVSHDGRLSYALVTVDRLPQRRAFFRALSRRCAPAVKGTPNELACRQFLKLAVAETIDEYFAGRTSAGDASPVPGLGETAVVSGDALYVRRGQTVVEVSVLHNGNFDLARSRQLASELLVHVPD